MAIAKLTSLSSNGVQSVPPEVLLTQMITGSLGAQADYVAAKLGIAGQRKIVSFTPQL